MSKDCQMEDDLYNHYYNELYMYSLYRYKNIYINLTYAHVQLMD